MKISILIPVYNEAKAIDDLLDSIDQIDYPREDFEVVVVNDGSTDSSGEVVKRHKNVRLINHDKNLGRFDARKRAMNEAKYDNLLYIDSRCLAPKEILNNLRGKKDNVIIGHSRGLKNETIFEIFYSAIRRQFFRRYYKESKNRIILTKENFDVYPKGTTVFFIKKNILKEIIDKHGHTFNRESSEDTRLFSYILDKENIIIDPDLWIINYGRDDTLKSLHHVIERGLHYTDYYLKRKSLKHWIILLIPVIGIFSVFFLLKNFGIVLIIPLISLWLLISVYLDPIPSKSLKIFIIGPVLVTLYYFGIIKGLSKILLKKSPRQSLAIIFTVGVIIVSGYYLFLNYQDFEILLNLKSWQILVLGSFNVALLTINGLFSWYLYKQFDINLGKMECIAMAVATSFGNTFLPFRAGIGGIAVYMKKRHQLSYSHFASTVAGAYVINFFVIGLLGLFAMVAIYFKSGSFSILVALAFAGLSAGSVLSVTATKFILRFVPFQGFKDKVNEVVEGWHIISKSPRRVVVMGLITALNSIVIGFLLYFQFKFLNIEKIGGQVIQIWDNVFLSSFSVLSVFLNITPSALGIKEGLFAFASQVINIRTQDAIVASVLDRIINASLLLIIGPLSLYFLKKRKTDVKSIQKKSILKDRYSI